jgi:hypothetical protein
VLPGLHRKKGKTKYAATRKTKEQVRKAGRGKRISGGAKLLRQLTAT